MPAIRLADIPNAGPQALGPSNIGIGAPSVPRFAINPQTSQLTGAAALDPNALAGVAKQMQQETYNLNAFSGEAAGLANMGDAFGDVATVGFRFSRQMQDAKDTADLARAETVMRAAFEKQQNEQLNTPVEKWQERWSANQEQAKKALGEIGLSNNAWGSLAPAWERWSTMGGLQIENQANKQRIEGYKQDIEANALMKIADDDIEGAMGIYNKAVSDGILSESQGNLAKSRLQDNYIRKTKEQQREKITSEILTDPRRAKEILTKAKNGEATEFGELDPSRVKLHLYEADRQIRATDSENWNSLVEKIQNGDIASKDQLKQEAEGMKIDPAKYKRLENAIAANIPFDPKAAAELKTKVAGYDFNNDPDDSNFYALDTEIASRLPKDHAQRLREELKSSWKKGFDGSSKSPRDVWKSDFLQGVERLGKSGLLGDAGLDKDGKTIVDQSKNNAYWSKVYSVQQGMEEWFSNPANKDKTPADAQEHRDRLIAPLLKGKALELFKQKSSPGFQPSPEMQTRMMDRADFSRPMPTPPPPKDAIDKAKSIKAEGKVTSYNFPKDPYSDSNSRNLIGAWNNKLTKDSLAISPDIERKFKAAGIGKGDAVELTLADGSTVIRTWDDRTMQDEQATRKFGKPLRGRFDFHSPDGKQAKDGMAVVSFRKAPTA